LVWIPSGAHAKRKVGAPAVFTSYNVTLHSKQAISRAKARILCGTERSRIRGV